MPTLFLRHAATGMAGRFCGHLDVPLSEAGLAQLPSLAAIVAAQKPAQLVTSDLQRAAQTAAAIASRCKLTATPDPRFREISFGAWEGLNWDEAMDRDPALAERWAAEFPNITLPGGEPHTVFLERVRTAAHPLLQASGLSVVVTHAGVIRALLEHLCDTPASIAWKLTRDYGCWVTIDSQHRLIASSASATLGDTLKEAP